MAQPRRCCQEAHLKLRQAKSEWRSKTENRRNRPERNLVNSKRSSAMTPKSNDDERPTEDDIAREKLGPRGIPGEPSPAKMTPQREKKTPKSGGFDGHTA
jgi:hypothetical protein